MSARSTRSTRGKKTGDSAPVASSSINKHSLRPRLQVGSNAEAAAADYYSAEEDTYESLDSDALDDDVPKKKPARRATNVKKQSSLKKSAGIAKTKRPRRVADVDDDLEDDIISLASDALDEDEHSPSTRKRASPNKRKSAKGARPRKRRKVDEDIEEELSDELDDGQEIVGAVVQAPQTGRVPPGQISRNTLDFLLQLQKPECNDREWFKLHEPVYRLAEKEWKDFIETFTDILVESDPQIPHLPPKDVTHRIYRDVRFSNDKTPYKTGFSASFSRSGRKGIFAGYHVAVRPGGQSLVAAGTWHPGKNEIATIRNNLQRSSTRLRRIISESQFERLFGEAKPHPKGERQNIFGMDDELKVAPKGVDKSHKDIDLLKCRSFAVVHRFTDKQVLQPDFKHELGRLVKIMRPFVHCINDLMTIQDAGSSGSEDEGEQDDEDEGEGEA